MVNEQNSRGKVVVRRSLDIVQVYVNNLMCVIYYIGYAA